MDSHHHSDHRNEEMWVRASISSLEEHNFELLNLVIQQGAMEMEMIHPLFHHEDQSMRIHTWCSAWIHHTRDYDDMIDEYKREIVDWCLLLFNDEIIDCQVNQRHSTDNDLGNIFLHLFEVHSLLFDAVINGAWTSSLDYSRGALYAPPHDDGCSCTIWIGCIDRSLYLIRNECW